MQLRTNERTAAFIPKTNFRLKKIHFNLNERIVLPQAGAPMCITAIVNPSYKNRDSKHEIKVAIVVKVIQFPDRIEIVIH